MADKIVDPQLLEEMSGKLRAMHSAEGLVRPATADVGQALPAILQRATLDAGLVTPAEVLLLQQTIGNREVQRLLDPSRELRSAESSQTLFRAALQRSSSMAPGRTSDSHPHVSSISRPVSSGSAGSNVFGLSSAVQRPTDMNAAEAVAEPAAAETGPRRLIQRQTLDPPPPPSLFPPRQGPSLVPGLHFDWHLTPQDRARIVQYLQLGHLSVGPGLQPVFNGQHITVDELIEQARAMVISPVPRDEVAGVVRSVWSPLVLGTLMRVPPPPPPFNVPLPSPAEGPAAADDDLQASLGFQWTWHASKSAPSEATVQVQLAQGSGAVQKVYAFSLNLTTGDVQAMGGVQLQRDTPTVNFLRGVLKATAFVQLVAGVTRASGQASGAITFQVQAGVQATATWGPVTVTAGFAPTFTLQQDQAPAVDLNLFGQGGQTSVAVPTRGFVPILSGRF